MKYIRYRKFLYAPFGANLHFIISYRKERVAMKGKKVKQINNWTIRYTELYQYAVWSPDGRCYEDRLTLEEAEAYCRENTDFLNR